LILPREEQKFIDDKPAFGGKETRQAQALQRCTRETGAKVEASTSRDGTLSLIIKGKRDAVVKAKTMLSRELQKEASVSFNIPQEHHRLIIGKGGSTLKDIQEKTGTFIKLNKGEDEIRINGAAASCRQAQAIIQKMSDEEAKRDRVVLEVVQAYHQLIAGHKNETIIRIKKETGVEIHMPPRERELDEITIAGERTAVAKASAEIQAIYAEKRRTCGELTARVPKEKHKYVIGPKAVNLHEIMQRFQVVVDIPAQDVDSDTIVLRGNQSSLVHALTCVYEKADSVVEDAVRIPNWLHRHVIGKKGAGIKKLTADFEHLNINFPDDNAGDDVKLVGPPEEVNACKAKLFAIAAELIGKMTFIDLKVDSKHFPKLIGKGGATIMKIKKATGVQIDFADKDETEKKDVIHIEGAPEGVAEAKRTIIDLVVKFENEGEATVDVDQKYHSLLIGEGGKKIKAILAATPEVTVDFPNKSTGSSTIILRGPKSDVALAAFAMKSAAKTVLEENHVVEVAIFKAFHRNVIGKSGETINKIKKATNVRIDVPDAKDSTDVITVTGKKADAELAKQMLLKVQSDIATIVTESVAVGKGEVKQIEGDISESISKTCGGVIIASDHQGFAISGPDEAVAKAKAVVEKYDAVLRDGGTKDTVSVQAKHHRYIIGRSGAGQTELEEAHGVLIIFPGKGKGAGASADSVTIFGKRTSVAGAWKAISDRVKALEDIVEEPLEVEKEYHSKFFIRKNEFLEKIKLTCGGVQVDIPKDGTTTLKLKGPKEDVAKAAQMITDMVEDVKNRVTVECTIPAAAHRKLIGQGGEKIRQLQEEFTVQCKFPDAKKVVVVKKSAPKPVEGEDAPAAAAAEDAPAAEEAAPVASRSDIIKVTGSQANCDKAIAALLAAVPQTKTIDVDPDLHRFIIGSRGESIRKMMETYDVFVKFPKSGSTDSAVKVEGTLEKIEAFEAALTSLVTELEATKVERELKNFKVTVSIEPTIHQKLIGKAGATITKFRETHNVQVDFPNRKAKLSEEDAKKIVITGLEADATAAGEELAATAKKYENIKFLILKIANGAHRKIIGKSGQGIKAIQAKYDVRINLPRDGGDEITIEGSEEMCLDCQEVLLDIEEEWEQEEAEWAAKRGEKSGGGGGDETAANVDAKEYLRTPFSHRSYDNPSAAPKKEKKQAPWVLPSAAAAAAPAPSWGGRK
jgi:polyribonucleotide nucleotidyltransferase